MRTMVGPRKRVGCPSRANLIMPAKIHCIHLCHSGELVQCISFDCSDEHLHHKPDVRVGHSIYTLYPFEPFGRTIQCMSFNCSDERLHHTSRLYLFMILLWSSRPSLIYNDFIVRVGHHLAAHSYDTGGFSL